MTWLLLITTKEKITKCCHNLKNFKDSFKISFEISSAPHYSKTLF